MAKVGYKAFRALSIGGALGDLRNDWDSLSRREQWWLDVIPWLIAFPAVVLIFCTLVLGSTVIHVNARTEHLLYTPLYSDPSVWLLKDTRFESLTLNEDDLFNDDDSAGGFIRTIHRVGADDSGSSLVNGFLQLSCGDRVTISRIGQGAIKVKVDAVHTVVVTDEVGTSVDFAVNLPKSFTFYPHARESDLDLADSRHVDRSMKERMRFTSYVWPLEGQIVPSRIVGVDTVDNRGLLLEGRVDLFNRRVVSGSNYLVSRHEIELGDHLVLGSARDIAKKRDSILRQWERQSHAEDTDAAWKPEACDDLQPDPESFRARYQRNDSADKGFVHIDEEKGMGVAYSSNTETAEIKRYRSSAIGMESNLIKRLLNDKLLTLLWSIIIFAFVAYRQLARAYIMSRSREEALLASQETEKDMNNTQATETASKKS